ncbi:DNA transposition AAA+ family ATPase [Wenyingzhuangia heitensis]|uniref:DNA transposition AAA+ family ATPase n=1 Tax=Wenyingzhuangia heitensis TaxID=1487859 RepID=A0ABX0U8E4_9FLAO|nr:AAA family ATPase [Wenyingzhuangia heitensis]NIJ45023.1 DNA transposition AAA+ family ATPase [Wenyingzhuangia heitensis]
MTQEFKQSIAEEVKFRITKSSQVKVSKQAKVSNATISQIVNDNWEHIAESLWSKVKVNLRIDLAWKIAPTQNLDVVVGVLDKVQAGSMSVMISDKQGKGKTTGYEYYARNNSNVILISCKNYWSKKSFARHQLLACGLEDYGTTEEMIERFEEHLSKLEKPLTIYDQFDKLKEVQKDLFMDYYNSLDGHGGFVLSGVNLHHQEKKGRNKNKTGYGERWSRVGSKIISLNELSYKDVESMCRVNGLDEEDEILEIFDTCLGDKRRVKRSVEQYFLKLAENKSA